MAVRLLRANDQNSTTFLINFLDQIHTRTGVIKLFGGTYTEDKYRDWDIDGGSYTTNPAHFESNLICERTISGAKLKFFVNQESRRTDPRGLKDYATWNYFPDQSSTRFNLVIQNTGVITTVCLSQGSAGAMFFDVSEYQNPVPGTFVLTKLNVTAGETIEVLDFTIGGAEVR